MLSKSHVMSHHTLNILKLSITFFSSFSFFLFFFYNSLSQISKSCHSQPFILFNLCSANTNWMFDSPKLLSCNLIDCHQKQIDHVTGLLHNTFHLSNSQYVSIPTYLSLPRPHLILYLMHLLGFSQSQVCGDRKNLRWTWFGSWNASRENQDGPHPSYRASSSILTHKKKTVTKVQGIPLQSSHLKGCLSQSKILQSNELQEVFEYNDLKL